MIIYDHLIVSTEHLPSLMYIKKRKEKAPTSTFSIKNLVNKFPRFWTNISSMLIMYTCTFTGYLNVSTRALARQILATLVKQRTGRDYGLRTSTSRTGSSSKEAERCHKICIKMPYVSIGRPGNAHSCRLKYFEGCASSTAVICWTRLFR